MKKLILIPIIILVGFLSLTTYSAVIFQDNFDNWTGTTPIPCNCGSDYLSNGWIAVSNVCSYTTYNGVTHYCSEVGPTGWGGRGYSLQFWRHGSWIGPGYTDILHDISGNPREIYNRWYMMIDPTLDLGPRMNYFKLWRYLIADPTDKASYREIYLNFNGHTFQRSLLQITQNKWKTLLQSSQVPRDGQWHCYELRIKINTNTSTSDGVIQFWLDGKLMVTYSKLNFGYPDTYGFYKIRFGIGNFGAGTWQTNWASIQFDNYVLSTTYVGPISTGNPPVMSNGGG
jgi:hypothetical protein